MTDHTIYHEEIAAFQQEKDTQLRAEDGWLTLAGLHWLREGINLIGGGENNHIPLPAEVSPPYLGSLEFTPLGVLLHLNKGVSVEINGEKRSGSIALESDINRQPTVVNLDQISFYIIQRGDRTGVRVKYTQHPNRVNFTGREWWPIDENFRLEANIIPYSLPKMITIPDILGDLHETEILAALQFEYQGEQFSLDAQTLPSGQYYLIFHDLSCGKGSYPPGRFLVSEMPEGSQVIVDFNKAYNPPCAFTPFATCP
ncbi:MAG: DUF1684 domain-containing protein, partial [Anaerolineales bacterium]